MTEAHSARRGVTSHHSALLTLQPSGCGLVLQLSELHSEEHSSRDNDDEVEEDDADADDKVMMMLTEVW